MLSNRSWKKVLIKSATVAVALFVVSCGGDDAEKKKAKSPATQVKEPIRTQQTPTQNYPQQQTPISWDGCGDKYFCDKGDGGIQLPSESSSIIGGYDAADVRACMKAVAQNSIPTYGPWAISSASRSFSIGDQNFSIDTGGNVASPVGAKIVMLNIMGALSTQEIRLDEPNTVYCVKSQMYFSAVTYKSCYPNNIIFLRDNTWLAANKYVVPSYCGGVPVWEERSKYY